MKKIIFTALIPVLIFLTVLTQTGCKTKDYHLEVDIELGYENTLKLSDGNPLKATIYNNGEAFEGELQIDVNQSGATKMIVAIPFEIASGEEKEITTTIPVYTIQKDFEIRIVSNSRKIYDESIPVSKFINPNTPVFAVISDNPDGYKFMNSINSFYIENMDYDNYYPYEESYEVEEGGKAHIFYFNDVQEISRYDSLDYFNYIYIGSNQSLDISKGFEEKILKWIEKGNTVITQRGSDYKRIQSQLPDSLINYKVNRVERVYVNNTLGNFELNNNVYIGKGDLDINNDDRIYRYDSVDYLIVSKLGSGKLMTLTMDLTEKPFNEWYYKSNFLDKIISDNIEYEGSNIYNSNNYYYKLRTIPFEKNPPYGLMAVILVVYIIVVGPVIYIVLKKHDRRDRMWVYVPAISFVCILVLYIFGFSTRYSKPILNSISTIHYEEGKDFIEVNSAIALFNNKKGNIEISWNHDEDITLSSYDNYYDYYDEVEDKSLKAKVTKGVNTTYEIYDAPLWSAVYVDASKVLPTKLDKNESFIAVDLVDGKQIFTVTNLTELRLEESYIRWGNGYIYVGNLEPLEEKTVTNITNKSYTDFYEFIRNNFDRNSNNGFNEYYDLYRMLDSRGVESGYNNSLDTATLFAVNKRDIGYNVLVNGKETENFNRNIVIVDAELSYTTGNQISLPKDFIMPTCMYGPNEQNMSNVYYDNNFDKGSHVAYLYDKGIADFSFNIPGMIEATSLKLYLSSVYNEEMYWESNGKANSIEGVKYYLYNNIKGNYEEIADIKEAISIDEDSYVDDYGHLLVRVDTRGIVDNSDMKYADYVIEVPSISIEGVVR